MPGLDRTGPQGRGSMTGRRLGNCNDNVTPGNVAYGRGGRGFGRGAGSGNRYGFGRNQQFSSVSEKTIIENEINTLKDQLSFLENQLNDLKDD